MLHTLPLLVPGHPCHKVPPTTSDVHEQRSPGIGFGHSPNIEEKLSIDTVHHNRTYADYLGCVKIRVAPPLPILRKLRVIETDLNKLWATVTVPLPSRTEGASVYTKDLFVTALASKTLRV